MSNFLQLDQTAVISRSGTRFKALNCKPCLLTTEQMRRRATRSPGHTAMHLIHNPHIQKLGGKLQKHIRACQQDTHFFSFANCCSCLFKTILVCFLGSWRGIFFCWGEFYFILTELLIVEFQILAYLELVRKELTRVCADRHGSTAPKLKLDMYHLPVPCRADCCPLRRQWATQLVGGMFLHEAYSESISCDAHALLPEILMRAHQSAAENSTKLMYCLSYVCKKDKYLTKD